jgi:hypothetical protein
LSLNSEDLSTSTTGILAICNQPQSYALVYDDVTNSGYKCKSLPPVVNAGIGGPGGSTSTINPLKCNNL